MQHYNYNSHIFIHKLHYYPMYILLKYQSNFVFAAALNCCCQKDFPKNQCKSLHSNIPIITVLITVTTYAWPIYDHHTIR